MAHGRDSVERALRVFVADCGGWTELTSGRRPAVRLSAPDLQRAQRARAGVRSDDVAVILDLTVSISTDFRSARAHFAGEANSVRYAGSIDGLAGLVSDIFVADVADGVTLIRAAPGLDVRGWAKDVLARLSRRLPVAA